ncbi:hypothetical protein NDAWWUGD_CDS0127 [Salmonella phage SeKF_80]
MIKQEQADTIRDFIFKIVEAQGQHNVAVDNHWYEAASEALEKLKKLKQDVNLYLLSITEGVH